jgi:hypothetical protein
MMIQKLLMKWSGKWRKASRAVVEEKRGSPWGEFDASGGASTADAATLIKDDDGPSRTSHLSCKHQTCNSSTNHQDVG